MNVKKHSLSEARMPASWYNVAADLPGPVDPPLHPGTMQPLGPQDLAPLFPMALIEQEVSTRREIPIPEPVMDALRIFRPTPLVRAERLERFLGTPARIFFKNESVSPAGSHKPNTAIPQAYYNAMEGTRRLVTETGAGQWGSSLALAGRLFGLDVEVYMVGISYQQKPYRRSLMRAWGAEVHSSPSPRTATGRAVLAAHPDSPGSLGIAISEAVERALDDPGAHYALGSVLNHVCLHQTVIGQEARAQMADLGLYPDVVIGCVGGGSNFAGLAFPFVPDRLAGRPVRLLAAEPASCPTLTRGTFAYDFGDSARLTPLVRMYTLGHDFVPPAIHAGGLRYHGDSPLVSRLVHDGIAEARAYPQNACFEAALAFARTEGILPAPESSHAIRAAIDEALEAKALNEPRTILFNLSGHGHFDMSAYDAYLDGTLPDAALPDEALAAALADLPRVPEGAPAAPATAT